MHEIEQPMPNYYANLQEYLSKRLPAAEVRKAMRMASMMALDLAITQIKLIQKCNQPQQRRKKWFHRKGNTSIQEDKQ